MSMASLKRRAFNQHLHDRICEHLAHGQSLEKSSRITKPFVIMGSSPKRQPKFCPNLCSRGVKHLDRILNHNESMRSGLLLPNDQ
jgi:hypothetical protein